MKQIKKIIEEELRNVLGHKEQVDPIFEKYFEKNSDLIKETEEEAMAELQQALAVAVAEVVEELEVDAAQNPATRERVLRQMASKAKDLARGALST